MPPVNNISSPDAPTPQVHPVVTAYERFVAETPWVTRTILHLLMVSYLLSFLVDLHFSMACIPQFLLNYYEIYRLVTSILVNQSLFSVLLAALSFVPVGTRLEQSFGSTAVLWLCGMVFTLGTNLLFVTVQCVSAYLMGEPSLLLSSSEGLWVVLMGCLAMECCHAAPYQSTRRLIWWDIPTRFYPIVLLVLFSLLSGRLQVSYAISLALGYGLGQGKLEFLKLPSRHVKSFEESSAGLVNSRLLRQQPGWVSAPEARGPAAWSEAESQHDGGGSRPQVSLVGYR